MVSPSGMILKCAYRRCPVFDKLEFVGMRRTIPSPGGKGDREAVDEEWRHLTICNAVNLNGTDFSNVPFSRSAYKYGTYRRSSSAPVCALGHLPPGGRYGAAHPYKFQFIALLRKTGMHIHGYLISYILPFISAFPAVFPTKKPPSFWTAALMDCLGITAGWRSA